MSESASVAHSVPQFRFQLGDLVFSRGIIENDGGIPNLEAAARLASTGCRGVVVRVGHVEADPRQTIYVVRFESADGLLGPPVGCLPEELTQDPSVS